MTVYLAWALFQSVTAVILSLQCGLRTPSVDLLLKGMHCLSACYSLTRAIKILCINSRGLRPNRVWQTLPADPQAGPRRTLSRSVCHSAQACGLSNQSSGLGCPVPVHQPALKTVYYACATMPLQWCACNSLVPFSGHSAAATGVHDRACRVAVMHILLGTCRTTPVNLPRPHTVRFPPKVVWRLLF